MCLEEMTVIRERSLVKSVDELDGSDYFHRMTGPKTIQAASYARDSRMVVMVVGIKNIPALPGG